MRDYINDRDIRRCLVVGIIFILLGVGYHIICYDSAHIHKTDVVEYSFPNFISSLKDDLVSEVYYGKNRSSVYFKYNDGTWGSTSNPETEDFKEKLSKYDVLIYDYTDLTFAEDIEAQRRGWVWFIVISGCVVLFVMCYSKISSQRVAAQVASGGASSGKSKADGTTKTFSDVAGLHEVKKDLMSLVDFLKNKSKYTDAGAKLPKGVIFYGPPGTGKTLLAKALSNEAGVSYLYASGSDFIEMYVGVGAKRIRELFADARRKAPCIIFIDELDTIGGKRSGHNANDEDRKAINALLTEMDGFKESENILVIGATNRLEDLDSALTRAGRFTDKYCIPAPETMSDRKEVLKLYMSNKKFSDDVVLNDLARETSGFTPAQIEALLNEAAILSVQRGSAFITKKMIDDAMSKMVLQGHIREDQSERDMEELRIVAHHEAGHALVGMLFGSEVTKVTILSSTSGAGGVTFSLPSKKNLLSVQDIRRKVMELYGGRASEELMGISVTTGASNDIERATSLIHDMVVKYGMDTSMGVLNLEQAGMSKEFILQREIELSTELYGDTVELLKMHRGTLNKIADLLLENETIYTSDLKAIIGE